MKIQLTNFVKRQFNNNFRGTKILYTSQEEFIKELSKPKNNPYSDYFQGKLLDGYAPFCKLLVVNNFTMAKTGTLPLSLNNLSYLKTGYEARNDKELPVLSRWLEIPEILTPRAEYLVIVLYSRYQCEKEWLENNNEEPFELDIDTDYGVVAILGQMEDIEQPMNPITMMRNALGISEGGSGVPLDREKYMESVEFWSKNAIVNYR